MDRRVRRTRQALRAGLVELTIRHGWANVTVAAIAEQADVGRTTFYEHFASKEELLGAVIEELLRSFDNADGSPFDSEALLQHAADQGSQIEAFLGIELFRSACRDILLRRICLGEPTLEARFAVGGIIDVIEHVARTGRVEPTHRQSVAGLFDRHLAFVNRSGTSAVPKGSQIQRSGGEVGPGLCD